MNISIEQIKNRIKEKYGTFKRFSEMLGISYAALNKVMSNPNHLKKMSASTVVKMFQLLDMDINESGISGIEISEDHTFILSPDERELINTYRNMTEDSKIFLLQLSKRIDKLVKNNQDVMLIPMRQMVKKEEEWEELAYLPQAAGMGLGSHAEEYPIQETIRCKASQIPEGTDFVILAEGDSMEPKFHDGDKLFVKKTDWLDQGDIGLVYFQGDEMVKIMGDGCLESINEKYPPIDITYDPDSFFIHGKVLGKMK